MLEQWLDISLHSSKVTGLLRTWGLSVWTLRLVLIDVWVSSGSDFLPLIKNTSFRLIVNNKLFGDVSEQLNGCLSSLALKPLSQDSSTKWPHRLLLTNHGWSQPDPAHMYASRNEPSSAELIEAWSRSQLNCGPRRIYCVMDVFLISNAKQTGLTHCRDPVVQYFVK